MAVDRNEEVGDMHRGEWSRKTTKLGWRVASMLEVTLVLKSSPTETSAIPIFL